MRMQIIKRCVFLGVISIVVLLLWKISICETTAPIEQWTEDGWFEGEGSQIREIRMYVEPLIDEEITDPLSCVISIQDEEGHTIWEKEYIDLEVTARERVLLEEYERGKGIDLGIGKYQITNSLSQDETLKVTHKIYTYNGNYYRLFLMCAVTALLFLAVVLILTMRKSGKYLVPVNFFTALVFMGILFSMIMPPLTVPDEESHFLEAYELSSKMMFSDVQDEYGNLYMRKTDRDSITYLHNASTIGRWYADFWEPVNVDEIVTYAGWSSVSATTPSYAYFLPALGISLARILKVNGHCLLLAGRLFNLLGTAMIMAIALYLVPFSKMYFAILLLLPETVYLVASYSYDAVNFALCFLLVAYFFYMIADGKKVRKQNLIIFFLIFLIMLPIKLVYASFGGLILLIPRNQINLNRKVIITVGALGALGIILLAIMRWSDIVALLNGLEYNTVETQRVSLSYVLENPHSVFRVFVNNLLENTDAYLKGMLGEFVGRERYEIRLDISNLPIWMMLVLSVLMALGISHGKDADVKRWQKAWIAVIGMCSTLLIFFSIYLANNVVTDQTIRSVQGRYFLPLLLLIPAFISQRADVTEKELVEKINWYMVIAVGINIIAIFLQLKHLTVYYYG